LVLGNLERRPELGVLRVGERDDGVQAVVAAGELDDDEDGVFRPRLAGLAGGPGGAAEERRHGGAEGDEAGRLQKFAAARRHGNLSGKLIHHKGTKDTKKKGHQEGEEKEFCFSFSRLRISSFLLGVPSSWCPLCLCGESAFSVQLKLRQR